MQTLYQFGFSEINRSNQLIASALTVADHVEMAENLNEILWFVNVLYRKLIISLVYP